MVQFNDDNFLQLLSDQISTPDSSKKKKNLFVFFTIRECKECLEFQKKWNQLSKVAHKQFKIASTDCHFDRIVCPNFNIDKFPFTILFKNNKIYRYKGDYEVADMLEFLSADNFMKAEIYHDNIQDYYNEITGNDSILSKIVRISKDFLTWSEAQSKSIFKRVGLYYWSDNSKLLLFSIVVVGFPTVIITFYFMNLIKWIGVKIFGESKEKVQVQSQLPQQRPQAQPIIHQNTNVNQQQQANQKVNKSQHLKQE
eukprot:403344587